MPTHEIPTTATVTDAHVSDLIITAVEHMGHGSLTYSLTDVQRAAFPGPAYSEKVAQALLNGAAVAVTDRWDYDLSGTLTLDRLLKGIGMRASRLGITPETLCEFIQTDVIDADCAVQYALWDRIVLG